LKASLGSIVRLCLRKERNKRKKSFERMISGLWEAPPF
jgi:hypothetical protein